jgi:hypothetical protein
MSEFRLLTPEEIDQVPGVISPRPSSFIMVGAVDEDGKVYAACGAFLVLHADPLWIRPDWRGRGRLLYRLMQAFMGELRSRGVRGVEVGMTDTNPGQPTESLIERVCRMVGGHELKARFFAVPIGEEK